MYFPVCFGILLGAIGTFLSSRYEELKGVYNRVNNMKMGWQPKMVIGSFLTWNVIRNTDSSVGIAKKLGSSNTFYVKVVDESYKQYYILFEQPSPDYKLSMILDTNSQLCRETNMARLEVTPTENLDTIKSKISGFNGFEVTNLLNGEMKVLNNFSEFTKVLEDHDDGPVD